VERAVTFQEKQHNSKLTLKALDFDALKVIKGKYITMVADIGDALQR
jgi:hypothetical protein